MANFLLVYGWHSKRDDAKSIKISGTLGDIMNHINSTKNNHNYDYMKIFEIRPNGTVKILTTINITQ